MPAGSSASMREARRGPLSSSQKSSVWTSPQSERRYITVSKPSVSNMTERVPLSTNM